MQVSILPVGDLPEVVVAGLDADLRRAGVEVTVLPPREVPSAAYDGTRHQYRAPDFLALARRAHGGHVLAVTEVDLYVEPLSFVFGQADVGGHAAVISSRRLSSEDPTLFRLRVLKEALHELGHNRGLNHCADPTCIMHFSNELGHTDRKGPNLCPACTGHLGGQAPWRVPD
ncbi:MAG: archaemetzincin family Zn-dependent metalloprotease [Thermoplasmata archaeon]